MKQRLIQLFILVLVFGLMVSLAACGSAESNDGPDLEHEIWLSVQSQASAYCILTYADVKYVLVDITTQEENSDGSLSVKGYVDVTDDYGDKYSGRFDAVVIINSEGEAYCSDFEMETPVKQ